MEILEDIYYTNMDIIPKCFKNTVNNLKIAALGFVYLLVWVIAMPIIMVVPLFGGILLYLLIGVMVSNYLYIIENIYRYGKFDFKDFKTGSLMYLRQVYMILFAMYVVNRGLGLFLPIPVLIMIANLLMFIFFNPLPEIIYQKHYMFGDMFTAAIEFVKENWIEWFIPNVIITLVIGMLRSGVSIAAFRAFGPFGMVTSIASLAIGGILFLFIGLYRAELFNLLDGSTRRKRKFKRNMYR